MKAAGEISRDFDLPQLAARVLITIRFQPGQTVTGLRDQLDTTTPTLARILGDLDQRGLIERRQSDYGDRRTRCLFLSHEGKRVTDPATLAMRDSLRTAYRAAGSGAVSGVRAVLEALI